MSIDSIDIKVDNDFQPVFSVTGDFSITSEEEGLLQEIKLEALTQEGELFYDKKYGWSLYDFIHTDGSELVKAEIEQRCKLKISKYDYVNQDSVSINISFGTESTGISISFKIINSDLVYNLTLSLDRVNIEVIAL